ncbi:Reticulon-like protein [Salvia divinorum]|uniref:Reticulon-like protein n=1 Tax=Salvia divinorum TaxID=28513 RepID=A0ABD1HLI2_SALDI
MDEIDNGDLLSPSDSEEEKPSSIKGKKVYRLFGRERPLHMLLGGGKHADVILWREKKVSAGILGGATAVWFLFEVLEYHFVSLICYALILGSALLFQWSNAASFLSRSLPEILEFSSSEDHLCFEDMDQSSISCFEGCCIRKGSEEVCR